MSVPTLPFDLQSLSVEDRLTLIDTIWESIEREEPTAPLSEAQLIEVRRCLDEEERNPDNGASWEDVKRRILGGEQ